MKKIYALAIVLLFSCNNKNQEKLNEDVDNNTTVENSLKTDSYNWKGFINNETEIILNYQIKNNLIFGEITYLNTENKLSKKIYGVIEKYEETENYRILEFDNDGNISSIFTGLPTKLDFKGEWFSPKTRESLVLNLKKDINNASTNNYYAESENIFGEYYYQYGSKEGSLGLLKVIKIGNDKMVLELNALTDEPARNIADLVTDTIPISSNFTYKIPDSKNCEIEFKFYKDVTFVNYKEGKICMYEFGHNASAEGIFLKKN